MTKSNSTLCIESNAHTVGTLAPDLFVDLGCGGGAVALSQLRGRVVVLVFARMHWDPARGVLMAAYDDVLRKANVDFVRRVEITDTNGVFREAVVADGTGANVKIVVIGGIDAFGMTANEYGVHGREALFVVDERGVIAWSYIAPQGAHPNPDDLLKALRQLSASTPRIPARNITRSQSLTRRHFLAVSVATAIAVAFASFPEPTAAQGEGTYAYMSPTTSTPGSVDISLNINGSDHALTIDPRVTLLDALRERLNLTGTKKGCDHGQCGACTVHSDGRRINSCLAFAVMCQGQKIVTIEGLAHGDDLHPMQASFVAHDGLQCGYCTPGQIMSAVALMSEPCGNDDNDVRESMSGNICRCGAYPNIVDAIQDVRGNRTAEQITSETHPRNN